MSNITVRGPNGSSFTFPPGTSEEVIRREMDRHYGNAPEQRRATASAARATSQRTGRRNLWDRFWDNAQDTWETSMIAENWRAGMADGAYAADSDRAAPTAPRQTGPRAGNQIVDGVNDFVQGLNPFEQAAGVVRSFGAAKGALNQGLFGDQYGVDRAQGLISGERTRREEFAAMNDAQRGGDSFLRYQREGDYVGLALHGTTALAGTLAGALVDPTTYLSGGRSMLMKASSQAAIAGGMDFYAQEASMDVGLQENFDAGRLALSAAAGGAFQALGDLAGSGADALKARFFRHPESDVAPDLDVGDDLARPALSETEVDTSLTGMDSTRVVTLPNGQEVTLRGPGSAAEEVQGGVLPTDYVENGRVWRGTPPSLANDVAPEVTPGSPEAPPVTLEQAHAPARYIDPASPEGQAWHSENKLLDDTGEPIVFYHGTQNETGDWTAPQVPRPFEEFDPGLRLTGAGGDDSSRAFFVSTSERTAKSYAGSQLSDEAYQAKADVEPPSALDWAKEFSSTFDPDGKLSWKVSDAIAYYLRAGDVTDAAFEVRDVRETLAKAGKTEAEIDSIMYDLASSRAEYRAYRASSEAKIKEIEENQDNWKIAPAGWVGKFHGVMKNPLEVDFEGGHYSESRYMALLDRMEAGGHDGIIIRNVQDGGGAPSDVFLFPNADQLRPAQPRLQGVVGAAPADADLQTRWDTLSPTERAGVGITLLKKYASKLLQEAGIAGTVREASGSLSGTGEPTVRIDLDDNVWGEKVLERLANLFNQGNTLVLSREPHPDYTPRDVAEVDLGDVPYDMIDQIVKGLEDAGYKSTMVDWRLTIADLREDAPNDLLDDIAAVIDGFGDFPQINLRKVQSHVRLLSKETSNASDNPQGTGPDDLGSPDGQREGDRVLQDELLADFDAEISRVEQQRPGAAGAGGGGNEPPNAGGLAPSTPEGPSGGNGEGGWDDVDWGNRRSPERAKAALKHLDSLKKWIKPEAVADFLRRMDVGIEGATEGTFLNTRWVDWDAFKEDPESLVGLHNVLADVFGDLYKAAGVKKQGWAETKRLAKQMGVTMSDVIKTHADVTGENGLTVKMFAMRDAFNASVDDAAAKMRTTLADIRAGKLDADAIKEVAALVQRSAILGAADASVSGEIARALQSRKMMSKPGAVLNDLQAAFDTLNESLNSSNGGLGDHKGVEKVLDELLKGYDKKGASGFNARLRKMRSMGVMDYIGYAAVANLLSGVPTHIKNAVGTPTHAVLNLSARFVAAGVVRPIRQAGLALAGRQSRSVTVRDTVAYMEGTVEALGEATMMGLRAFAKGAPIQDDVSGVITDVGQVPFAYNNARLQKWVKNGPTLSTIGDVIGVAYFEIARTFGFRPSVAMDEFNKTLARRAELRSLALREAMYESAKLGPGDKADKAFEATHKAILEEPTAEAVAAARTLFGPGGEDVNATFDPESPEYQMQAILKAIDVRQASQEHAELLAYQQTGGVVESLEKFLRKVPIIKHFAANFVRTPTQLFVAAFRDYNPVTAPLVIGLEALSPVGRARHKAFFDALAGEEDALAGGGAAAEMVIARQIVGAGMLGAVYAYWADGGIVGAEVPPGDEYAGVLPYSIRLPNGTWVQFTGFSPVAEHLGLVADVGQIMRNKETTDDQDYSLIGAMGVAFRGNVFNKSFLKGFSDLFDIMSGGDFASKDPNDTAAGLERGLASLLLGRVIPLSSFMKRLTDATDTNDEGIALTRDARSWMEQVTAYLPNRRESLALKRDFMGRPILKQEGEVGVLQAAKTSRPKTDPLDVELHNLAARPVSALDIRPTPSSLDGIKLDAHEHNRLQEIQGQLFRNRATGRNMEEELRHLISTDRYRAAPPEYRETLIKGVITEFRRNGKKSALNPNSPLYMREMAARTGPERIRQAAAANGWDFETTFSRRGRAFGLTEDDRQELQDALSFAD